MMSEALAFASAIRLKPYDLSGYLVMADWWDERGFFECGAYCRAYAERLGDRLSDLDGRVNRYQKRRKRSERWHGRQHCNMVEIVEKETESTLASGELLGATPALLWFLWEIGNPYTRAVLFTHHCFQTGDLDTLRHKLYSKRGVSVEDDEEDDEEADEEERQENYIRRLVCDTEFELIRKKEGVYDISAFVRVWATDEDIDMLCYPKGSPFTFPDKPCEQLSPRAIATN